MSMEMGMTIPDTTMAIATGILTGKTTGMDMTTGMTMVMGIITTIRLSRRN